MGDDATAVAGTRLGPYRIERLLGEGAMGEVYLAIHEALGRQVAIKTLKPVVAADRSMTERFFAEARAVNIIRHENIVECTDLVNDPTGKSYIVMELLEGRTLGDAIREAGKMAPRRAALIAAQIADALGAAHGKGIVHRDLKPENIFLIKRAGSSDYVKVLDFGMARLRPDLAGGVAATQSGALIGTPAYMSPEQARGEKATPAADIYALGAVLFNMLTGQMPFKAQSLTLMLVAVLQETPPRVERLAAGVPPALSALVERALAKDPARRPADMATFRRELLAAMGIATDSMAATLEPAERGETRNAALDETLAPLPAWAGQSSLSAGAGEVVRASTGKRRWWLVAGGLAVAGAATAIALSVAGSSGGSSSGASSAPGAAMTPATAPAMPAATPTPPPAPLPATALEVTTPVPEPTAPVAPAPATPASANTTATTKQPKQKPVTSRPASTTIRPETTNHAVATGSASTGSSPGSGAAATGSAAATAAPEPVKTDRTKQLVGPAASPSP
jgi:tRNA A-37 threonylcarbamoyl transferase component Bud32